MTVESPRPAASAGGQIDLAAAIDAGCTDDPDAVSLPPALPPGAVVARRSGRPPETTQLTIPVAIARQSADWPDGWTPAGAREREVPATMVHCPDRGERVPRSRCDCERGGRR